MTESVVVPLPPAGGRPGAAAASSAIGPFEAWQRSMSVSLSRLRTMITDLMALNEKRPPTPSSAAHRPPPQRVALRGSTLLADESSDAFQQGLASSASMQLMPSATSESFSPAAYARRHGNLPIAPQRSFLDADAIPKSLHQQIMAEYAYAMEQFANKRRVTPPTEMSPHHGGAVKRQPPPHASWFAELETLEHLAGAAAATSRPAVSDTLDDESRTARRQNPPSFVPPRFAPSEGAATKPVAVNQAAADALTTLAHDVTTLRQKVLHAEMQRDQLRHEVESLAAMLKEKAISNLELERHIAKTETSEYALRQDVMALQSANAQLRRELVASSDTQRRESILANRLDQQAERRLADAKVEITTLYQQMRVSSQRIEGMEKELLFVREEQDQTSNKYLTCTKSLEDALETITSDGERLTTQQRLLEQLQLEHRDLEWAFQDALMSSGRLTLRGYFAGSGVDAGGNALPGAPIFRHHDHRGAGVKREVCRLPVPQLWNRFILLRRLSHNVEHMPAYGNTAHRAAWRIAASLGQRIAAGLDHGSSPVSPPSPPSEVSRLLLTACGPRFPLYASWVTHVGPTTAISAFHPRSFVPPVAAAPVDHHPAVSAVPPPPATAGRALLNPTAWTLGHSLTPRWIA